MAQPVEASIKPNVLAALPGRMVDEAPKRYGRDAGGRDQKLLPSLFGLLGGFLAVFVLVMVDAVSLLFDAEGLLFYLGIFGLMMPLFVGMLVGFGGYTYLNLRTRSYTLYDDRVEMTEGFLKSEKRAVPYAQITDISVSKNIWERQFGAGTVQIRTTGGEESELWIRGINDAEEVAERIRQRVGDSNGGKD